MGRDNKNDRSILLGYAVDIRYYDDECALTEYIWRHYTHLMTGIEVRAGQYAAPIIASSEIKKVRLIHEQLEMQHGPVDEAAVMDALRDGRDTLRDRVRNRLLMQYPNQVFINRCPACRRIVRSPLARQCPWCKHNWHDKNLEAPTPATRKVAFGDQPDG